MLSINNRMMDMRPWPIGLALSGADVGELVLGVSHTYTHTPPHTHTHTHHATLTGVCVCVCTLQVCVVSVFVLTSAVPME